MKNYSKRLLLVQLLLVVFIGCKKYQSQDLLNTKLTIDRVDVKGDFYSSKNLDNLFSVEGYTYFEPDYTGTSFDDYYVKNIVVQDKSNKKYQYILFFDNKDILKDTLRVPANQIYSLNVLFENNKKGIALGSFDQKTSYFKINKNFELDKNLKLKPLPVTTKIIECSIPIALLSEENVGLEDQFTFGTQKKKTEIKITIATKQNDDFSQWQGNYLANFEISKTDGDYHVNYDVKVLNKDKVSITEKINDENNPVSDIFIESVSEDKLVIKSKTDDTIEYIIAKIDGKYYLMGNTIYMLNPPNDKYLLKKN
jgi:hypothetical protein